MKVGSVLGSQLLQGALPIPWLPPIATHAAAQLLRIGVPLRQYSDCNSWGDHLGDLVKFWVWGNEEKIVFQQSTAHAGAGHEQEAEWGSDGNGGSDGQG